MNIDQEPHVGAPSAGDNAEVGNLPFVDHETEADVRNAMQVGHDFDKRVRAGQKRVRNRFSKNLIGCTDYDVGA